nr:hypothetical protein [Tanacetum cinerariifolium]
ARGPAYGPGGVPVFGRFALVDYRDSHHSGVDSDGHSAVAAHRADHQHHDPFGLVVGHRYLGRPGHGGSVVSTAAHHAQHPGRVRAGFPDEWPPRGKPGRLRGAPPKRSKRLRARQAGLFGHSGPAAAPSGAGGHGIRRGLRGRHWGVLLLYRAGHDAQNHPLQAVSGAPDCARGHAHRAYGGAHQGGYQPHSADCGAEERGHYLGLRGHDAEFLRHLGALRLQCRPPRSRFAGAGPAGLTGHENPGRHAKPAVGAGPAAPHAGRRGHPAHRQRARRVRPHRPAPHRDPVLAGSLLLLLVTGQTLNLQSYMGIIMSVGVSVANAVLIVTNAESLRLRYRDALAAARLAGAARLRPVLMTSIAMVAGMLPMASGLGESGEQSAPLGRARSPGQLPGQPRHLPPPAPNGPYRRGRVATSPRPGPDPGHQRQPECGSCPLALPGRRPDGRLSAHYGPHGRRDYRAHGLA